VFVNPYDAPGGSTNAASLQDGRIANCEVAIELEPLVDPFKGVTIIAQETGGTVTGTELNDTLLGGHGPDHLLGGDGDDLIWARHQTEGDDNGLNTLEGEGGNDRMFGGPGRNVILGGPGDDRLQGGLGSNTIEGGPGNDTLRLRGDGRIGATIRGGPGNDVIHAMGRSTDRIECGSGRDVVYMYGDHVAKDCEVVRRTE
jgi:Ca2+-binding RTX toxin-like protein